MEIGLASSPEDDLLAGASGCWQEAGGVDLETTHIHARQAIFRLPGCKSRIFVEAVRQVPVVGAFDLEGTLDLVLRLADGVSFVTHLPTFLIFGVLRQLLQFVGADVVDRHPDGC